MNDADKPRNHKEKVLATAAKRDRITKKWAVAEQQKEPPRQLISDLQRLLRQVPPLIVYCRAN